MIGLFARLGWYLAILLLAFPMAVTAQSEKPKRVVYQGVETRELAFRRSPRTKAGITTDYWHRIKIDFTYVEEFDAQGFRKVVSHKISWDASGESVTPEWETTFCRGQDGLELVGASEETKRQKLKIPCTTKYEQRGASFLPLDLHRPPSSILPPKIVGWDQLRDNCSYSEEGIIPFTGELYTYSVWVSAEPDAVMEVNKDEYRKFVPTAGTKIWFHARSNIPVRFRFKLEEVSRFPGYATNANVDVYFYKRYPKLVHLADRYRNDSPDLIFDPEDFKDRKIWKAPRKNMNMLEVETAKDIERPISVPLTVMDFGAHGRLSAEVKSKCAGGQEGGWEPVTIRIGGQQRSFLTIPLDENENLIADRMEQPNNGITKWSYQADPGRDDDNEPKGDGTPGDGLTAFEEYRGFIGTGRGGRFSCLDPRDYYHRRTDPAQKDLFVETKDAELGALALLVGVFTKEPDVPKGIGVHIICEAHQVNRVVNFNPLKSWRGKTLSLGKQHALRLIDRDLPDGVKGQAVNGPGTPKYVDPVIIDKQKILGLPDWNPSVMLARTVIHELGHAIGIPHHGDGNINGDVVLFTELPCPENWQLIKEALEPKPPPGSHACLVSAIARRHGQNSGNHRSPMKYIDYLHYESPTKRLKYYAKVKVNHQPKPVYYDAYTGVVYKYRRDLDAPVIGFFANTVMGTGINALPGEENHAGYSCRIPARHLRINDRYPKVPYIPCPKAR